MAGIGIQVMNPGGWEKLHAMVKSHEIDILNPTLPDNAGLPGVPMSVDDFENWLVTAENSDTLTLQQAQEKWNLRFHTIQQNLKNHSSDSPNSLIYA
ncbi:MAG: hypothetical protein EBX41_07685 [Chitinophagia bacterium]|nr:hypothetical protein [Chitinophagia bacterium]